jgi:hypothetical protein
MIDMLLPILLLSPELQTAQEVCSRAVRLHRLALTCSSTADRCLLSSYKHARYRQQAAQVISRLG